MPEFLIHIKTCPKTIPDKISNNNDNNEQKKNLIDLCLNNKICYIYETHFTRNRIWTKPKEIICPCIGKYSYECGLKYCSKDQIKCEAFQQSILTTNNYINIC